ncbi:MAG: hypothetical protein RLZZ181_594 [Pseudomonadota bacterium]
MGLYKVKVLGRAQSASTAVGLGLRIAQGTATISTIGIAWAFAQGANGVSKDFRYDQISTADNVTSVSSQAANTNFIVRGEGMIRVTVAGTVAIQFRSETTGAVTLQPDTSFILELA